ncbi:MAG: hypothetical protein KDD58_02530 [Bdellovibrionales bacterium]|nr:hypothetical protein [Bdellovibrionales bacterium]
MAVWQYSLFLISKNELLNKQGKLPDSLTEDERENLIGWEASTKLTMIEKILSKHFKKKKSWSNNIEQWGEEDSHCVEVICENDRFSEVSVRLDLRNLNGDNLRLIVDLAETLDAIGLNIDGIIFEVSLNNLKSEIKISDAFSFVKDPKGFLSNLSN